jgi:hypothetical protein
MNVYNYRSSTYDILKNTLNFITGNNEKKITNEINFLDTIFVKKIFSDFYFLFFNPKNVDFYFLEKISFLPNIENLNSLITDLNYLSDFELMYKISKRDKIKNSKILYSDEILPFGKISDISSVSFETYIGNVIPISSFIFPEKSFSFEISFILFFSKILNNEFFLIRILPPVYIFVEKNIQQFIIDNTLRNLISDFRIFAEKIFTKIIPSEIFENIDLNLISSGIEKYVPDFFKKILFVILLRDIKNVDVPVYKNNFIFKVNELDIFYELKFKIEKFLKYDFWDFHKLSFYYFITSPIKEIENTLISEINSKYSVFKKIGFIINFGNSVEKVNRSDVRMFLRNFLIYFLFYYVFNITLLDSAPRYFTKDNKKYLTGDMSSRIYYIYNLWNNTIGNLEKEFLSESDYVESMVDKIYDFVSNKYSKIYGKLNNEYVSTYPSFNLSVFTYHLKKQFVPAFYSYLMRDIFFNKK